MAGALSKMRLEIYSYFEKGCRKNVHATIPKGNMGYDQYTFPNDCSCRTYFCCFPLTLSNICPWPLVPFFQISFENRADKTTHNTFRDCRVHFFRQPFSKQLYTKKTEHRHVVLIFHQGPIVASCFYAIYIIIELFQLAQELFDS